MEDFTNSIMVPLDECENLTFSSYYNQVGYQFCDLFYMSNLNLSSMLVDTRNRTYELLLDSSINSTTRTNQLLNYMIENGVCALFNIGFFSGITTYKLLSYKEDIV